MQSSLSIPKAQSDGSRKPQTGWRRVKFGDVVRFVKEDADPDSGEFERYVAGEHIETDNLHIRSWGTIGDGYLGPAFHRKFVRGQVLYGSRRTYLRKIAVAAFDGITANTTFVLEPNGDDLIPELLPFIMQTEAFTAHSIKQSKGSVNPYINWKDLAWFEFMLPPKDEQRRIAEILWAADEVEQKWAAARSELRFVKEAVLNNLSGNKDYAETALGDVIEHPQYGLSIPLHSTGRYPIFRMMNFEDGRVVANDMKFVDLSDDDFRAYKVYPGDLLFNRTNSADLVGKVGIFELDGDYVFASYLVRLRCKQGTIEPHFLNYYLNSDEGQRRILAFATPGVSQTNINASNLQQVRVPLPELSIQRNISSELKTIDSNLKVIAEQLGKATAMKMALRSRLLAEE